MNDTTIQMRAEANRYDGKGVRRRWTVTSAKSSLGRWVGKAEALRIARTWQERGWEPKVLDNFAHKEAF